MIIKAFNKSPLRNVPKFYSTIIRPRYDKSSIGRKLTGPDPISMSINRELEFLIMNLEDFEGLII